MINSITTTRLQASFANECLGYAKADKVPRFQLQGLWQVVERSPSRLAGHPCPRHWGGATHRVAKSAPNPARDSCAALARSQAPTLARHLRRNGRAQTPGRGADSQG